MTEQTLQMIAKVAEAVYWLSGVVLLVAAGLAAAWCLVVVCRALYSALKTEFQSEPRYTSFLILLAVFMTSATLRALAHHNWGFGVTKF